MIARNKNLDDISTPGDKIRIIEDLELRDPALNIGLEEAISSSVSEGSSPPTVRFWRNRHSAIIGRSQDAEAEIDIPNCRESRIPLVRRPTGGGAVLHHPNNLNYSLYLPKATSDSVEEESKKMSEPVASALSKFGLEVRVSSNGLYLDSTKLGGTAQSRRLGLLHHGTILVKRDSIMEQMLSFLRAGKSEYEADVSRVASKPDRVSDLNSLVKGRLELPELVKALTEELSAGLDLRPYHGAISGEEWELSSYLAETKYSSPEWTFRFNSSSRKQKIIT